MTGDKRYELSNHLGNVLVVVSDKKIPLDLDSDKVFNADVLSYNDYYPFGMLVPNRHGNSGIYRYGFNGKEKDDEIKGEGNSVDYGFRMHDPRIGRFFTVDPLTKKYPELTSYQFASNSPISGTDMDGLEYYFASDGSFIGIGSPSSKIIRVVDAGVAETYKNKVEDIHKVATNNASKYYTIPKYKFNENTKKVGTENMEVSDLLDYAHITFGEGRGNQAKEFAHVILNGEIKTANRIQKLKTTDFGWKTPHTRENSREIRQYEDIGEGKDIVSLNILAIGLPRSWATTSGILHNGDNAYEVNKLNVIQKNKDGSPMINGNYAEFFKEKSNIPILLKIKGV